MAKIDSDYFVLDFEDAVSEEGKEVAYQKCHGRRI
jgi:citrate lyase beta subunit